MNRLARALAQPFLAAYALFLRWTIYEAEAYLLACARDGLHDSLSLREYRNQIAADRCRLARVYAAMSRTEGAPPC